MTVLACFDHGAQMTQAQWRPRLAAAFEPALPLQAGRFHRTGANRPAAVGDRAIVHPGRVSGKVILFAADDIARRAMSGFESGDGFSRGGVASVAELMQLLLHPRARGLTFAYQSLA